MAFKCAQCGEAQPAKTTPNRFVYAIRQVRYLPLFVKQGKVVPHPQIKPSFGQETVNEALLCDTCFKVVKNTEPYSVGMKNLEYFPPLKERKFFTETESQAG